MPRAYKLPNAAATIVEIEAAQEVLNDLQTRARELASSIGSGVTRASADAPLATTPAKVIFGLQPGGKITADSWVFIKTRDAVEPARGAKGEAREALAALSRQP